MNLTQNQDCSKRLWHQRRQTNHHTQFPRFHYDRLPDVLGMMTYCRPASLSAVFDSINKNILRFSNKKCANRICENRHIWNKQIKYQWMVRGCRLKLLRRKQTHWQWQYSPVLVQFISSSPSGQWATPSHLWYMCMHDPFVHSNWLRLQATIAHNYISTIFSSYFVNNTVASVSNTISFSE